MKSSKNTCPGTESNGRHGDFQSPGDLQYSSKNAANVAGGCSPGVHNTRRRGYVDLTGQVFGRWTVLGPAGMIRDLRAWLCRCSCPAATVRRVAATNLRHGRSLSCGCLKDERQRLSQLRHGMSHTPEHRAWDSMQSRCLNPKNNVYKNYGGRGIAICQRWLGGDGFVHFLADMGRRPGPGFSLDRFPDTNGNYEPTNCRWATMKEQQRNKRDNRPITFNGRTMLLCEWAESAGITTKLLFERLRRGWSLDAALVTKLVPHKQRAKNFWPWLPNARPRTWLLKQPTQCAADRTNPREPGRCKSAAMHGSALCRSHARLAATGKWRKSA